MYVCHTFQNNFTNFESSNILSVSNINTNVATLPVSQLGATLGHRNIVADENLGDGATF